MSEKLSLKEARQIERLKFIDLCAYVLGFVNRNLLTSRFNIESAYASRDIKEYQRQSFEKLTYNTSLKAYEPVGWFEPMFEHSFDDAFMLMSESSQKIRLMSKLTESQPVISSPGIEPDLAVIAPVFRAISREVKVEIDYISTSSGATTRLIAPHSLIKAGSFKYVRAFDHRTGQFRVFKLNRIIHSKYTSWGVENEISKQSDSEWNKEVVLVLAANKGLKHKEAIEFDFGLTDGQKEVQIKKAMIPFFLMDWNIAGIEKDLPSELFPLCLREIKNI